MDTEWCKECGSRMEAGLCPKCDQKEYKRYERHAQPTDRSRREADRWHQDKHGREIYDS